MKIFRIFLMLGLAAFFAPNLFAQSTDATDEIVEVSGMVIIKSQQNRKEGIPFASVSVKGTHRGSYANFQGMFSIVAREGEILLFSAIGYEEQAYTVPAKTESVHQTVVIELAAAEVQLEEIIVFPWPDRDNLRAEFLAMQPDEALQWQDLAQRNLTEQRMLAISEGMTMDGSENSNYYLQMQAKEFTYMGQRPATPLFDPLAWARLFKSWKQKKKEEEINKKQDEGN